MRMGIFLCGRGGDGENFMGMGTILFTVSLSTRYKATRLSISHTSHLITLMICAM